MKIWSAGTQRVRTNLLASLRFGFCLAWCATLLQAAPVILGVTNPPSDLDYNILLGRPTDRSMAVSILSSKDLEVYVAYGLQAGLYPNLTATNQVAAGAPSVITLEPLAAGQPYYYRLYYRGPGGGSFSAGAERSFHTCRAPGDACKLALRSSRG